MLYDDLVPWYLLLDPPAEHAGEMAVYLDDLRRTTDPLSTLLELGAGAGNNATHVPADIHCTLTDVSARMLGLSRAQNPRATHVQGDMRTLRLGTGFDAVLVHDAICYMTTLADLRAAATTAWVHTRPGGAALFAPDHVRDTFEEGSESYSASEGDRTLHCTEWTWDPDPTDTTYRTEFGLLLREGGEVRMAHDTHIEGLFSEAEWVDVLRGVGFEVEALTRDLPEWGPHTRFVCRRPIPA